ncbi:MAG: rane-associated protein [Frankiaceae bacterium]|jgi:membrane-associated protein|nr:rane-associated protein [Frankiaceae bacterium]
MLSFDLSGFTGLALYVLVWGIVFVESGLLIGFFLPGDTLLVAAGILCAGRDPHANIAVLCAGTAVAAILGDNVGYTIGRRAGRPLLERRDGRVLNQHNLTRATAFYERFGSPTIVIARVVPMVRTFAPLIAGCTAMRWRTFFTWNVVGGILWGVGVPYAGYQLGERAKGLDKYALAAAGVMVVLSIAVAVWHYVRAGRVLVEEQREVL